MNRPQTLAAVELGGTKSIAIVAVAWRTISGEPSGLATASIRNSMQNRSPGGPALRSRCALTDGASTGACCAR